jgi:hypothetical protein
VFEPVEVPAKVLFKPNKNFVAELEKKDYLGKAKVSISSLSQNKTYSAYRKSTPPLDFFTFYYITKWD